MPSPCLEEVTQGCFNGCCPNPILKGAHASEPLIAKTSSTTTTSACRRDFTATTASCLFSSSNFTNHESIPSLQESFLQFIKTYPKYSDTAPVDRIRARDYGHLELSNHVSLDYIGVGMFSHSQIAPSSPQQSQQPEFPLFGISFKPVSLKSQLLHGGEGSELESIIKKRIMEFLNLSESEYAMVFTVNRSAAFKLVAESYPFSGRKLVTVYDHESEALASMISTSRNRGAGIMEAEFKWPRLRVHSSKLRKMIMSKTKKRKHDRGLFVFPLQSRMTGASYSYQWLALAQEHGWHVVLDACTLSPKDMDAFGLSLFKPDFLVSSFYKVFGQNPTGFGCLFVKKSVVPILEASAGGGIVSITPPKNESSTSKSASSDIQIQMKCLDHIDSLGLTLISSRSRYLINWLITALMKLHHPNRLDEFPLVTIYGPKVKFDRAPALAFNICDWKGEMVEPALVQKLADRNHISLGNGTLQHIWVRDEDEKQKKVVKGGGGISAVTVAIAFLANFEDVYRLWAFVAQFLDADFVEKERWRYTSLNQKTIEV